MKISSVLTGKIMDTDFLKKRWSVIAFLIFVIVLYMYCKFQFQSFYREFTTVRSELMVERAKASTINAERVKLTRESYLIRLLEQRGVDLEKSNEPPMKIE